MITQQHSDALKDQAIEWIVRLNNPQVSSDQRRAFAQWLAQSEQHKRAFDQQLAEFELLETLPIKNRSQLQDTTPQGGRFMSSLKPILGWCAATACVLLALLVNVLQTPEQTSGQHHKTLIGEIRTVTLADGSVVTLNTASHIEVAFTDQKRWIKLHSGEAYFTVKKDPNKPFEVLNGDLRAVALGTQFNVLHTNAQQRITVTEGRVRIDLGTDKHYETEYILSAGERVDLNNRRHNKATVDESEAIALWRKGQISFHNTPLLEAITELNRYLDKPATLAHPGLHYRTLSANFSLVDPKSVLEAIALSEGLTLEAQHHQWLLSDAPVR